MDSFCELVVRDATINGNTCFSPEVSCEKLGCLGSWAFLADAAPDETKQKL